MVARGGPCRLAIRCPQARNDDHANPEQKEDEQAQHVAALAARILHLARALQWHDCAGSHARWLMAVRVRSWRNWRGRPAAQRRRRGGATAVQLPVLGCRCCTRGPMQSSIAGTLAKRTARAARDLSSRTAPRKVRRLATGVFSSDETTAEQMARLAHLRRTAPEYAAAIMHQGQELVELASAGRVAAMREIVDHAREVRWVAMPRVGRRLADAHAG